jgi:hypothetical protein
MTSWCDKLASVPTIGITLTPHYQPASTLVTALTPLLDRHVKLKSSMPVQTFTLDRLDAFDLAFHLRDGFHYILSHSGITISFKNQVEIKAQSADVPTLDLLSESGPYTKLLPIASQHLVETATLITEAAVRRLIRVGVVTTTSAYIEEMPPGIQKLLELSFRPWGDVTSFGLQLASKIEETEQYVDRCVFTITKNEDDEAIPTTLLDFQRTFKNSPQVRRNVLNEVLHKTTHAALAYFERIGEGANVEDAEAGIAQEAKSVTKGEGADA